MSSGAALAIDGGTPVRTELLPYGRQIIDEADKAAVAAVLQSDWLTTGPRVGEFEEAFASSVGAEQGVAVSNGTAALHTAMYGVGVSPGDEVIVPSMTFAATANAAVFQGATPVFVDSDAATLLADPSAVAIAVTEKTKAVIAVDYAGQCADYDVLRAAISKAASGRHIPVIADACHALGGTDEKGRQVGSIADLSTFSFHPVKPLTTGEGGMVTTNDAGVAARMRQFRNHCLSSDHRERHEKGGHFYAMEDLGWNYRLTDMQCALGLAQLPRVPKWTVRRQEIAARYDAAFATVDAVQPLGVREGVSHAYHLYVVLLDLAQLRVDRDQVFAALRAEGIGVNVHYIPVHLHPYYRQKFGTKEGQCPVAEDAYTRMISLPCFAGMSDKDADDVVTAVTKVVGAYGA